MKLANISLFKAPNKRSKEKKSNLSLPTVLCLTYAIIISILLRFLNTQQTFDLLHHQGYAVSFIVIFMLVGYLYKFNIRYVLLFSGSIILYEAPNYVKAFNEMMVNERSIMQTLAVSAICFGSFGISFYISRFIKNKIIKNSIFLLSLIFCLSAFLPPLIALGYGFVSGGKMLSPDIILTLFQTNPSEVQAYLHEQNIIIWIVGFAGLIILFLLFTTASFRLKTGEKFNYIITGILGIFLSYLLIHDLPRMTLNSIIHSVQSVRATLDSFEAFNASREIRLARLNELKKNLSHDQNGIYMVIMGESTTRDHMHAYGYYRENTPWLDTMKNSPNTIIFQNAYANHVHTIPAVTYALTEQNQYSNIELEKAYSLIDIATAAGFETYWISNQKKYSASNTPVVTMSQSADHQIFLNDYIGNKSITTYYDEKLADSIPDLSNQNKAFIIVHLMGCHAVYADRYEGQYAKYDSHDFRIDSYDNCVLYNDYVLSKLYERVKDHPEFMALFYISDHGEDPDHGLTHESSKFTYQMSHIPFIAIVSDKFKTQYPDAGQTMSKHRDAYWSSDLLYNLVTDIMMIEGLPRVHANFSIASEHYDFTKDKIRTLHGQKKIIQDTP